jgi:hypothetical protein
VASQAAKAGYPFGTALYSLYKCSVAEVRSPSKYLAIFSWLLHYKKAIVIFLQASYEYG